MNIEDLMKQAQIAAPCSVEWDDMTGDDKVRFCGECKLNVFNAAEMSGDEVAQSLLRAQNGERVCMQLYRRADGTFLTKNCPVGVQKLRERAVAAMGRAAAWIAGAVSVLVSAAANAAPDSKAADETKKPTWHSTIKGECEGVEATNPQPGSSPVQPTKREHVLRGKVVMIATDEQVANQKREVARCKAKQAASLETADAISRLATMHERRREYKQSVPLRLEALKIYDAKKPNSYESSSCWYMLYIAYKEAGDNKKAETYKQKYDAFNKQAR